MYVRNQEETFLGLPIFSEEEQDAIFNLMNKISENKVLEDIYNLGTLVMNQNILIFKSVQYSSEEYFPRVDYESFDDVDIYNSEDGISDGFEFLIGIVSLKKFLTNNKKKKFRINNEQDLIKDNPLINLDYEQLTRFQQFISGQCLIDRNTYNSEKGLTEDSSDISEYDYLSYLEKNEFLDSLISIILHNMYCKNDHDLGIYSDAFLFGVENCVELYIQQHEQILIKQLENN